MRDITSAGAALAALLIAAVPGAAATVGPFTSFWALGDSLSDPGNLHAQTGGQVPESPPYFEGRSTNGPVWAERVAGDFEARGLPTGNFAFSYAGAQPSDDLDPRFGRPAAVTAQIPDLPEQVSAFRTASENRLGERPVVSIWAGSNDIFDAIRLADPGDLPGSAARVASAAHGAASAVADTVVELGSHGVADVLVFNLPALERTPAFSLPFLNDEAAGLAAVGSDIFNATLAGRLELLPDAVRVRTVDAEGTFDRLVDNPEAFGFADATLPCFIAGVIPRCTDEEAAARVFFDSVHPTAAVHALIADVARAEIAPVPLPAPLALLVAGIAGLAWVGRRRASA